jgi:DNA repair exonuclease SbcCD ATPase subunit
MILRSAEVTSFKVLKHVKVTLGPGLNVIHGANDTGKTTLMLAITTALTRRAKLGGRPLDAMKPRDGSTPEVELAFEHAGTEYTLKKRFAGAKGTTRLVGKSAAGRVTDLAGDDAESALRTVLGVGGDGAPTKRKDEGYGGIWPVVWVEQARSHEKLEVPDEAHLALSDRLSTLSGGVLAGAGAEPLFRMVEQEYERHFTSRTAKLRAEAPLYRAQSELAKEEEELTRLAARLRDHEGSVDRHAELAREVERLRTQLPELEAAARAASTREQKARELSEKHARAMAEVERAELVLAQADARARTRQEERDAVEGRGAELAKLSATRAETSAVLLRHDESRAPREASLREAEALMATLDAVRRRAVAQADVITARRALAELGETLTKAREHHGAVVLARARLAQIAATDAPLETLGALEKSADRAAVALETASASIEVRALAPVALHVDDVAHTFAGGETLTHRADDVTTVRVPGMLEIRITPGGKDLAKLRDEAATATRALRDALAAIGARDVAHARHLVDERKRIARDIASTEQLARVFAPSGLAALEQAHVAEVLRVAVLESALDPMARGASAVDPSAAHEAVERTARDFEEARRAYHAARDALAGHGLAREKLDADDRVAAQIEQASRRQIEEKDLALARSLSELGDDAALATARDAARADATARRATAESLAGELALTSPDDARLAAERTLKAVDGAGEELAHKTSEMHVLAGSLGAADLAGLHDRVAAADTRVEIARAEVARLGEQTSAVKLLYDTLDEARGRARRTFLEPLRREVEPLLHMLFASGRLELDDKFGIAELSRDTHGVDAFDTVGGGSKEQLGILVRLAMANVLAGDGTLPVMLDDAIVFTSEERFERMANVLSLMARKLQIILFTCHWERYRALGVDHAIDLAELRRASDRR